MSTLIIQSINHGQHDFILFDLSIKKNHAMSFRRENSSNDFFNSSFLVQEQRKIKFSPKIIRRRMLEKNIKISSKLEPIKPQCSAGPVI